MVSINVSLMYKIIGLVSKGPVLALRISNTQEKVRNRTRLLVVVGLFPNYGLGVENRAISTNQLILLFIIGVFGGC